MWREEADMKLFKFLFGGKMKLEDYVRKEDMNQRFNYVFVVTGGSAGDYPKEHHINDYQDALEDFKNRLTHIPWYTAPELKKETQTYYEYKPE